MNFNKQVPIGKMEDNGVLSLVILNTKSDDTDIYPCPGKMTFFCETDFGDMNCKQVQKYFDDNPGNLYISKNDFDKFMSIWANVKTINMEQEDVEKFIENMKRNHFVEFLYLDDEHQHVWDKFYSKKLIEKFKPKEERYLVLLKEEVDLRENLQPLSIRKCHHTLRNEIRDKITERTKLFSEMEKLTRKIRKLEKDEFENDGSIEIYRQM